MTKPALAAVAAAGLMASSCMPGPAVLRDGAQVCALLFGEDVQARDAIARGLEAAGWLTVTEPSNKCQPNVFMTVVFLPLNDDMGMPLAYSLTVGSWAQGVTLTPLSVNSISPDEQQAIDDAVANTVSGLETLRSGEDAVISN